MQLSHALTTTPARPYSTQPMLRIESTSGTGTVTVHAEGGINKSPLRGEETVELLGMGSQWEGRSIT